MVITLQELEQQFGQIVVRVHDLRPVMKTGGIMGLAEVKERFNVQRDPDGIPWAPLTYPRPEGGMLPLRNHGILAASYTYESDNNSWRVGTNHPGARLQHFGGTVVPTSGQFLTLPITREAVYAGRAPDMPNLHVEMSAGRNSGALVDPAGVAHWLLVRSVTIPSRKQVGTSPALMLRWSEILVDYLRTGSMF